jgi:signal transduction histidine kinase
VEPLEYVLSPSEPGLVEMRAFIFELRPEALEPEGLVSALEKQAAALRARHEINVRTSLDEAPALHLETREALYRIALEVLQDTVRHAGAANGSVTLDMSDDGTGFDPTGVSPGHLGLKSMRERA